MSSKNKQRTEHNQQPRITKTRTHTQMKNRILPLSICAASAALASFANAATVTWGSVQGITAASNIISTGVTSLAGADFGRTTGTTTVVNNGDVNIEFKSLQSGQSAALSNGITVAAASAWENWGANGGISALPAPFGTILDYNLGIEGATSATITLSGLVEGTQYQIQFFADSTGSNSQTISATNVSGTMNSLTGQFVVGTFTADATSQVLTVTRSTDFGVANALTIGVIPEPSAALLGGLGLLGLLRRRRC
jgi:hypothetical protein